MEEEEAVMASQEGALKIFFVTQEKVLLLALVVTLLSVGLHSVFLWRRSGRLRRRLPPGPWPWPLVGNLPLLGAAPHRSLAFLAQKYYGPLMYISLGARSTVVVSSPAMAKEFFKNHDQMFQYRSDQLMCSRFFNLNKSIIASKGPYWRHLRKICSTEVLTPARLRDFEHVRKEEISMILKEIFLEAETGKVMNLKIRIASMSYNILSQMIIGKRFYGEEESRNKELQKFKDLMEKVLYWVAGTFIIGDCVPSLLWLSKLQGIEATMKKLNAEMTEVFQKLLDEHRNSSRAISESNNHDDTSPSKDFMDVLLLAPREDGTGHLSDDAIQTIVVIDFLGGGSELIMIAVEWALAELLRNPEIVKQAQSELDTIVGRDRIVEESDLKQLDYLQAIVKETLRLHPPLPIVYRASEETEWQVIQGYSLPPKLSLMVNVWAIGHDPNTWENPLEFNPQRFMQSAKDIDVAGHDFELLPFGSGRRVCPGRLLSDILVQIILARMLQSFDWFLPDEQKPENLDMSEKLNGVNLPKAQPLLVLASPRLPVHLYE